MAEITVPDTIRVLIMNGRVSVMKFETYLAGAVASAIGPSAPLEALKAQAVASRTYAVRAKRHTEQKADVCTHAHCMKWKRVDPIVAPEVFRAVSETWGTVALCNGELIEAFYFENCAGKTRDAEEMAMPAQPYLRGIDCPCGFTEMKGHGVGMCQRGAIVMARQGASFKEILKHYYRDVEVVQTRTDVSPIIPDETPRPMKNSPSMPRVRTSKSPFPVAPPAASAPAADEFSALLESLNQAVGLTAPTDKAAPPKPRVARPHTASGKRRGGSDQENRDSEKSTTPEIPSPAHRAGELDGEPPVASEPAPAPQPAGQPIATGATPEPAAPPAPAKAAEPEHVALGQIHVDNLPGPKMIAGCLSRAGVQIEVEDVRGWKMSVFSGSALHYGEGGFEIALQEDGYYTVHLEGKLIEVSLHEETIFLREESST